MTAVLGPIVDLDAVLCSESAASYRRFAKTAHIAHTAVNPSARIRMIDHAFHIQNVNAYHGRLKGWMRASTALSPSTCPTTSAGGAS